MDVFPNILTPAWRYPARAKLVARTVSNSQHEALRHWLTHNTGKNKAIVGQHPCKSASNEAIVPMKLPYLELLKNCAITDSHVILKTQCFPANA
jgi:hypothetical protein